jgi:hypothetical protein
MHGKKGQHMIEKRYARVDLMLAGPVQVQFHPDLGLFGNALFFGLSFHNSPGWVARSVPEKAGPMANMTEIQALVAYLNPADKSSGFRRQNRCRFVKKRWEGPQTDAARAYSA